MMGQMKRNDQGQNGFVRDKHLYILSYPSSTTRAGQSIKGESGLHVWSTQGMTKRALLKPENHSRSIFIVISKTLPPLHFFINPSKMCIFLVLAQFCTRPLVQRCTSHRGAGRRGACVQIKGLIVLTDLPCRLIGGAVRANCLLSGVTL